MSRPTAYPGAKFTIAFAVCEDGSSPGEEFYDSLSDPDQAKVLKIFQYLGDQGDCFNRKKFKKIGDGFFEFKSHQIRMPCWFECDRVVVITHGFRKKGDDIPRGELQRAERIRSEDLRRQQSAGPADNVRRKASKS